MLNKSEMSELKKILAGHDELFEKIQKDQEELQNFISKRQKYKVNQTRGIEKAKEKGIICGRPKVKLNKKKFDSIIMLFENNHISSLEAAKALDISQSTFIRRYKEYRKEKEK